MPTGRRRTSVNQILCTEDSGARVIVEEHVTEVMQLDFDGAGKWIVNGRRYTLAGRPVNLEPDGTLRTVDPPERLLRPVR